MELATESEPEMSKRDPDADSSGGGSIGGMDEGSAGRFTLGGGPQGGGVLVGRTMPIKVPVKNQQPKSKQFGPIYHGSTHNFKPGDIIKPSTKSNLSNGQTAYAHASTSFDTANQYAIGKMLIKGRDGKPLFRPDGKPVTMNRHGHPRNSDNSLVQGTVYKVKPLSSREVRKTTKDMQPGIRGTMDSGPDHLVSSRGFKVVKVVSRGD